MATHEAAAEAIVPAGPASPPTGTVSVLFTNVEANRRLWEREPDAMARALQRHDELIELGVANHRRHARATARRRRQPLRRIQSLQANLSR
jgi:hypothetical protein